MTPQDRAVRLYAADATTRQIGAELGVADRTVSRWLAAAGVELRPCGVRPDPTLPPRPARRRQTRRTGYTVPDGPLPPRTQRRILTLLRRGASVAEAAEQLGVHVQRIYAAARLVPDFGHQIDALIPCTAPPGYSGAPYGYRLGCRCAACRGAMREVSAARRRPVSR